MGKLSEQNLIAELRGFADAHRVGSIRIDMDDVRTILAAIDAARSEGPATPKGGVEMLVSQDWLRRKVETDPDIDVEAGVRSKGPSPTYDGGKSLLPLDDDRRPFADSLLPEEMIRAGMEALDRVDEDHRTYVAGKTTDWDTGMVAVAVYRAMTRAALLQTQETETKEFGDLPEPARERSASPLPANTADTGKED